MARPMPLITFTDYSGRLIRYPEERQAHVSARHPYMEDHVELIQGTLASPDEVRMSVEDPDTVMVYYRWYWHSSVGAKYVRVVVKLLDQDAFVLTAHVTDNIRRGELVWTRR